MTIFGISAIIVWIIAAVVFGILEAVTMGLITIWFVGGSVLAAVAAGLGFSLPVQILVFLVVSLVLLVFTRPVVRKKLKVGSVKTNVDALVGKEALVTEPIKPFSSGQAKVDGIIWTAIAPDNQITLESGEMVLIEKVQGVKLIVKPLDHKNKEMKKED